MPSPILSPALANLPPSDPTPEQLTRWLAGGRDVLAEAAGPLRLYEAIRDGRATGPQRRRLLGRLIDGAKAQLGDLARWLAENLEKGTATLTGWWKKFAGLAATHQYAGVMTAMGTLDPTPADRRAADGEVRMQLGYLMRFREQLRTGAQPLFNLAPDPATGKRVVSGHLVRRSELYGESLWLVAEQVMREKMVREGFTHERRILSPGAHTCHTCRAESGRGWAAIGSLRRIGDSECKSMCRCFMEFSHLDMIGDPVSSPLGGRPA